MILHTVVPFAEIFPSEPPDAEFVPIEHGFLCGSSGKIDLVFSTDPADYLNPVFIPGEPIPPDVPSVKPE